MRKLSTSLILFILVTPPVTTGQESVNLRPEKVLSGHRKRIGVIAFSPDGRTLATGSDEPTVRLWEVATGQTQAVFVVDNYVGGLSFGPEGRNLATWSYGSTIRLWDVRTGKLGAVLTEPKAFVGSVSFNPDGTLLASSSLEDLSAKLWNTATGRREAILTHPKPYRYANGVGTVAFSPDGRTLVTSSERTIYLWDVATAQMRNKVIDPDVRIYDGLKALKGFSHGDTIYDLAISPDGRTLATASRDGTAKVWDLATAQLRLKLKHKAKVIRVVFSPDSSTLATSSEDRTVRLWDVATADLKATLTHKDAAWSLSFSADSILVATASDNEKWANVWRVSTGELLATLPDARPPVVFNPVSRTLATASRSDDALLWDVNVR